MAVRYPAGISSEEYAAMEEGYEQGREAGLAEGLAEGLADGWDEGAEATADWMSNNPAPSGIPVDPPNNPHRPYRGKQ